jgi:hypothetical protein
MGGIATVQGVTSAPSVCGLLNETVARGSGAPGARRSPR